jgi:hypothetical protein
MEGAWGPDWVGGAAPPPTTHSEYVNFQKNEIAIVTASPTHAADQHTVHHQPAKDPQPHVLEFTQLRRWPTAWRIGAPASSPSPAHTHTHTHTHTSCQLRVNKARANGFLHSNIRTQIHLSTGRVCGARAFRGVIACACWWPSPHLTGTRFLRSEHHCRWSTSS